MYTMYGVSRTSLGLPLNFFHFEFDHFDVDSNSIVSDNFKGVIKYQTFQTSFCGGFESVENPVFSFQTSFG